MCEDSREVRDKTLNPSWRPSWRSEGLATKQGSPEFRAEAGGRRDNPCSVHKLADIGFTPCHHYVRSQLDPTEGAKSFQEGPQTEFYGAYALLSMGPQVRKTLDSRCHQWGIPSFTRVAEAANLLRADKWPSLFLFLSSFCPVGLGKEPEREKSLTLFCLGSSPFFCYIPEYKLLISPLLWDSSLHRTDSLWILLKWIKSAVNLTEPVPLATLPQQ